MSRKPAFQPSGVLLAAGLLAGLIMLLVQKGAWVIAQPPEVGQTDTLHLAAEPPQEALPEVVAAINGKEYVLEVATTQFQIQRGLMYRTELADRHGMLFAFHPPRAVNFWMKNTRIPLDMVFLRRNQVVHVVHNAQPCLQDPCREYPSMVPVDMVIELPAGTAKRDRITIGSPVALQSPETSPPTPTATSPESPDSILDVSEGE